MRNGLGEVYSTATQYLLMRTSEGEVEVVHRDGNRNPQLFLQFSTRLL